MSHLASLKPYRREIVPKQRKRQESQTPVSLYYLASRALYDLWQEYSKRAQETLDDTQPHPIFGLFIMTIRRRRLIPPCIPSDNHFCLAFLLGQRLGTDKGRKEHIERGAEDSDPEHGCYILGWMHVDLPGEWVEGMLDEECADGWAS
jgi:hypothetical protein